MFDDQRVPDMVLMLEYAWMAVKAKPKPVYFTHHLDEKKKHFPRGPFPCAKTTIGVRVYIITMPRFTDVFVLLLHEPIYATVLSYVHPHQLNPFQPIQESIENHKNLPRKSVTLTH